MQGGLGDASLGCRLPTCRLRGWKSECRLQDWKASVCWGCEAQCCNGLTYIYIFLDYMTKNRNPISKHGNIMVAQSNSPKLCQAPHILKSQPLWVWPLSEGRGWRQWIVWIGLACWHLNLRLTSFLIEMFLPFHPLSGNLQPPCRTRFGRGLLGSDLCEERGLAMHLLTTGSCPQQLP